MKGFYALSVAVLPLLASASPIVIDTIHNGAAPIHSSSNAKEIPGSYIVVFKDHVRQADAAAHHHWVQALHLATEEPKLELRKRSQIPFTDEIYEGLKHTYDIAGSLLGYSGHFDEDVIEKVRRHPDVRLPHCIVAYRYRNQSTSSLSPLSLH